MKKVFYVALMAIMVMMTACEQSKEDYIKEFKSLFSKSLKSVPTIMMQIGIRQLKSLKHW